jgi:hypothetical protein
VGGEPLLRWETVMKKQKAQATEEFIEPRIEVYDSRWRFLGTVADSGMVGATKDARRFFRGFKHLVPTLELRGVES